MAEPARVITVHGSLVGVEEQDGTERVVPIRGSMRREGISPVVGDHVIVDPDGAVAEVLPRAGVLRRASEDGLGEVLAANVDLALIVTSLNRDLNVRRLERFLSLAAGGEVPAQIVLTKAELDPDPFAVAARIEREVGAPALPISVFDGWGVEDVRQLVDPGKTGALVGMSGVGKSTLLNALLGEERQHTLPIRESDDRGRHATSRRELFRLANGAFVIDTPGIRLQGVASADGLDETFNDIAELAAQCRFADCSHTNEPGCAVRDAVDPARLEAYRRLQREARYAEERQGGPGEAARRARGRAGSLQVRRAVAAKRPRGPEAP